MRRRHPQLYGILFNPCCLSIREMRKVVFSSAYAIRSDFRREYEKCIGSMQIMAKCAKIFIMENWKRVKDWRDLKISIVDNTGKETFYYNHKKTKYRALSPFSSFRKRNDERRRLLHNPVRKISDAVLDTSDGDFSIKINGKWHNWIDDQSVIVLADYIENQLKNKNGKRGKT